MTRRDPPERWIDPWERWEYGGIAVAFVVSNIGIAVFGWFHFWQDLAVNAVVAGATVLLFRLRYRGANERSG